MAVAQRKGISEVDAQNENGDKLICGKACNGVPQRGGIGDQVDPPSFVVETPFHQATTVRPAGLICGEKIGLARRRLPPTAVPSRSGSEMSAECGTPLYAD